MELVENLKSFFSKKKSIDKVTIDELRREKVKLDQEERLLIQKVEDLDRKKQDLFVKGKDEPSQRQQFIIARKIKELDAQAQHVDRTLQLFSKQIRIVNGLMQVKENQKVLQKMGVTGLLNKMDLEQLQAYIESATVDGQFYMEKFTSLLKGMEEQEGVLGGVEKEADVEEIVKAMQRAKSVEETNPEEAVNEGIKTVETILRKEKPEEA
jgi:hypothetical protein